MPISNAVLVDVLEDFLLASPADCARMKAVRFGAIHGRHTQLPTPVANLIGLARPVASLTSEQVQSTLDVFQAQGLPFGWLVGPRSPRGLAAELLRSSMRPFEQFAGLATSDLRLDFGSSTDVRVREVSSDERDIFADVLACGFELPRAFIDFMCDCYFFAPPPTRARNYLAYVEGAALPVAAASSLQRADVPVQVLAGSAVLKEHRHRGVYRAMVTRRLLDGLRDGMQAAVIQAVRDTSAPTLLEAGFREICSQKLYAWFP